MSYHEITKADFDSLLAWLDEDRDAAAIKYEEIRRGLIIMFAGRRCLEAEELADETITRVALKASELAKDYEGNPANYFCGVANNVHREWVREMVKSTKAKKDALPPDPEPDIEQLFECLEGCLKETLAPPERKLALDYYRSEKLSMINQRKALAEELKIGQNALRIRLHRIRADLLPCILECLDHP